MTVSTPQERREALAEALYDAKSTPSDSPEIRAIQQKFGPSFADMAAAAMPLVESWLAEKDAEIERLRIGRFVSYETARDMADEVRADERRRITDEIVHRVRVAVLEGRTKDNLIGIPFVIGICDEVGGEA